jgi:hypothetical protein
MDKGKFRFILLSVIIAGFLGGMISNLFTAAPLFAEKKSAQFANAIKAESFELVDKQGKTRAKLTMGEDQEPMLVVYDKNEKATAYGLSGEGPVQNLLGRFLRP